jgi:hypothetical protein
MKFLLAQFFKQLTSSKFKSFQKGHDSRATSFPKTAHNPLTPPHLLQVADTIPTYNAGFKSGETIPSYHPPHSAPTDSGTPVANPAMPPPNRFKMPVMSLPDFKHARYPLIALLLVGFGLAVNWFLTRDTVDEITINKVFEHTREGKWDETNVGVRNPAVLPEGGKEQVVTRLGTLNAFFDGVHDNPTVIAQTVFNGDPTASVTIYSTDGVKLYTVPANQYLNHLDTQKQKALINCTVIQSPNEQVYLKEVNILEISK